MAFTYKNTLLTVLLVIFTILVMSPQLGAACRSLSSQDDQWPRQNKSLFGLILRGPAPPSHPDLIH
ncbi:hypothetical protein GLYMA_13G120750v4 [Glycine max]|nr:hypothetical protein GLYMA_13G120750v4 [Glycine max]KAH1101086.1 hypothetical protein GYH30_035938 [Glycine max]